MKRILSILFFPLYLLFWPLKFIVNQMIGTFVGKLILPSQTFTYDQLNIDEEQLDDIDHSTWEAPINKAGLSLKTCCIHPEQKSDQYIIMFVGNQMVYQQIYELMIQNTQSFSCNVIGFNYRGVLSPENNKQYAQSVQDMIDDGIAQVQYLLAEKNISPENIILEGVSIGGGVATMVAAHYHTQEPPIPINLYNLRSFSSFTNLFIGQIRTGHSFYNFVSKGEFPTNGHDETTWGICMGWLAYPWIKLFLSLSGWELNAGEAYLQLPEKNKNFSCIQEIKTHTDGGEEQALLHSSNPELSHGDTVITAYGGVYNYLDYYGAHPNQDRLVTGTKNYYTNNTNLHMVMNLDQLANSKKITEFGLFKQFVEEHFKPATPSGSDNINIISQV